MSNYVKKHTPWGPSQDEEVIADGITWYSTPSHGGFKVDESLLQTIPPQARTGFAGYGWYEEDCDAAVVIYYFPQFFPEAQIAQAREIIINYNKFDGYYTKTFGLTLD